ncbi:MAG: peptide chain release factor N(5)-glutamine methyltransferase [Chloroflexota bacterium]|nr:peptide chain release factor N(5)-glutamine methyltransferase [Chloroflexota bacterium]
MWSTTLGDALGGNGHDSDGGRAVPVSYFNWQLDAEVTVGLALVAATRRLKSAGLDTPRLDSEVLLAEVMGWDRTRLFTDPDRQLSDAERQRFEELVERRFRHEPVAYLIERKAFYNLELFVDHRVLIPRPETELLVDLALDLASQLLRLRQEEAGGNGHGPGSSVERITVADIGTGSGAVGLAIALNASMTDVYAVDISDDALAVARENARRCQAENLVTFFKGDLLEPLPAPVDIVVANLPYIALHELDELAPGITDFEPTLALTGGADGLSLIRRLLVQSRACLRPQGAVLLEIGAQQGTQVAAIAREQFPEAFVEVLSDYGYRDRIVRVQS